MIIICPNCSTRYEVAAQAIGDHGRSVQCANCANSWHAMAEQEPHAPDATEIDDIAADEDALDSAFQAEEDKQAIEDETPSFDERVEKEVAEEAQAALSDDNIDDAAGELSEPKTFENAVGVAQDVINSLNEKNEVELSSYAARRRQQIERMKRSRRIAKRRREIARGLPMARLRRNISYGALSVAAMLVVLMFSFQTKFVQFYPDLAGFYRLFGQTVNVVGLNFVDVRTNRIWRDGNEVLTVRSKIVNETDKMISLSPIRVALIGAQDQVIYEWNSTPGTSVLEGGGAFDFQAELTSPPAEVKRVQLRFLDWQPRAQNWRPRRGPEPEQ